MKHVFLFFAVISAFAVSAQGTKAKLGGYGMAYTEFTTVNGKPAQGIGGYGGLLVNHKWLIGISGINVLFRQDVESKSERFQFNNYGLYTEYRFLHDKPVNLTLGVSGSMGWVTTTANAKGSTMPKDGDFTYVLQPQLGIDIKVFRFMQVRLNGGYRFSGKTNSTYYSGTNMNGVSVGAGLSFGAF